MTGLDLTILGVMFLSALIGLMRGFTKEVLSLFSWGGAVTSAYVFLPLARGPVHGYISNPMLADGVAAFGVFIVSLIVLSIGANMMAGYIQESSFKGVDRSLGFGFGLVRGLVFICGAELLMSTFWPRPTQPSSIQSARFTPLARKGGDTLLQVLPVSLRTTILTQAARVESQMQAHLQERLKQEAQNLIPGERLAEGMMEAGVSGEEGTLPLPAVVMNQVQAMQGASSTPQGQAQGMASSPRTQASAQMVVIRPPQPGQAPRLAISEKAARGATVPSQAPISVPTAVGLGQSIVPQDPQTTVDKLAQLKPQASSQEESGYTQRQRDDMNRLFQTADGE